jgi:hypothetical protein
MCAIETGQLIGKLNAADSAESVAPLAVVV